MYLEYEHSKDHYDHHQNMGHADPIHYYIGPGNSVDCDDISFVQNN